MIALCRRWGLVLVLWPLLVLPLLAQESPPAPADAAPPADEQPADAPPVAEAPPPAAAPEPREERVSADNNLSFPVDI